MGSGGHNFIDMTGERVGRLLVQSKWMRVKGGYIKWLCLCDCGNIKFIRAHELRRADRPTLSRGSLHLEVCMANIMLWNAVAARTLLWQVYQDAKEKRQ
jgi:hypothetical protein